MEMPKKLIDAIAKLNEIRNVYMTEQVPAYDRSVADYDRAPSPSRTDASAMTAGAFQEMYRLHWEARDANDKVWREKERVKGLYYEALREVRRIFEKEFLEPKIPI
jgi:hypothetical protein